MITISFQAASISEIKTQMKEFLEIDDNQLSFKLEPASSKEVEETLKEVLYEEEKPKKKSKKKKKEEDALEEIEQPQEEVEDEIGMFSIEDVQEALQKVNVVCGMPTARKVLAEFDVKKMSEIPEVQFKAFIKRCEEVASS